MNRRLAALMDKISSMNAFVKVVESRSFSLAATQLGVGNAAVTRSISNLEKMLGVKLMERTTRRLSLTPAGKAYLECCRNVLGIIDSIEAEISGDLMQLAGSIRVGLSNVYGNRFFGSLLTKFAKIHPGIRLDVLYFDLYNQTTASEVDIAFLVSEEKRKSPDIRSLGTINLQLFVAPEYIARHGRPSTPVDLIGHRCLTLSPQPAKPVWRFVEDDYVTDYRVNSCLSTTNGDGLLQATLEGLGIACLPSELACPYLQEGVLETVLDEFSLVPLEVSMALPRAKMTTYQTKAMVAFASEEFALVSGRV